MREKRKMNDEMNQISEAGNRSMSHCRPEQRFRLPKHTKLRYRSLVERLFASGNKHYEFPLRMMWQVVGEEELKGCFRGTPPEGIGKLQMLITVPKKKRKLAVDRVLLRRRIREAYRLNRHILEDALTERSDIATIGMAFIYIHNENIDYATIERKMVKMLHKIRKSISDREVRTETEIK